MVYFENDDRLMTMTFADGGDAMNERTLYFLKPHIYALPCDGTRISTAWSMPYAHLMRIISIFRDERDDDEARGSHRPRR